MEELDHSTILRPPPAGTTIRAPHTRRRDAQALAATLAATLVAAATIAGLATYTHHTITADNTAAAARKATHQVGAALYAATEATPPAAPTDPTAGPARAAARAAAGYTTPTPPTPTPAITAWNAHRDAVETWIATRPPNPIGVPEWRAAAQAADRAAARYTARYGHG